MRATDDDGYRRATVGSVTDLDSDSEGDEVFDLDPTQES
ncbi:MAG: hypothetical protein QOF20_1122, partial [Acidimicrobiaceae bacterium]|nr:hypothetical protein [Acidimicrobiaceae bacterium]